MNPASRTRGESAKVVVGARESTLSSCGPAHLLRGSGGPQHSTVHGAASNIRPGLLPHTCHRSGNYTDSAAGHGHLAGAKTPIEPHC